jgi:hypothetical protein
MLPSADEPSKPLAVIKIIGLTGLLLGIGWAIYAPSRCRAADEARGRA